MQAVFILYVSRGEGGGGGGGGCWIGFLCQVDGMGTRGGLGGRGRGRGGGVKGWRLRGWRGGWEDWGGGDEALYEEDVRRSGWVCGERLSKVGIGLGWDGMEWKRVGSQWTVQFLTNPTAFSMSQNQVKTAPAAWITEAAYIRNGDGVYTA